nr:Chain B, Bromodomain-containing protein 3 [Homo sapiens]6I5P_B Chain B, Bromodomain-containing protein 3 [Homo sapiens]6I5P_D Chain D, Bromodomain-containing protein 3 [Homo sapiens]6I5P_F Chain F, Bromodomain-containing protein 3 [Homo sapiens]6I5P_H Chain H, Bromodomain-containing protein 3 [Homo sapiens]6I68_B Chain B, Bromodomain-containing protein 3 [Homo sapiens]6I68_D Chain D, Bromodomain-containing protein 3 [Homo sapiens]6I68_F Chain F, Bromodomain-containing protein 3 [Homo sapi
KADTTTPTT